MHFILAVLVLYLESCSWSLDVGTYLGLHKQQEQ